MLQSCFAAGTPLLAPDGSKLIEQFRVGDRVLSRSESDAGGPLEAKVVEEVFVRTGRVWHLHAGGQVIRTTAEHPFWADGKGWAAAAELEVGDRLLSHDGRWVAVEDLLDTGDYETVYNLRIADYHTYFVGCDEWGFSVWAHNQYREFRKALKAHVDGDMQLVKDAYALAKAGKFDEARTLLSGRGVRADVIERALPKAGALSRPSGPNGWRVGFKEKVNSGMPTTKDGKPMIYDLDKSGSVILRERLPGEAGEIGHIPGKEHRTLARENAGMTQPEFTQLLHDHPEWFRIETRRLNASHKGEVK